MRPRFVLALPFMLIGTGFGLAGRALSDIDHYAYVIAHRITDPGAAR